MAAQVLATCIWFQGPDHFQRLFAAMKAIQWGAFHWVMGKCLRGVPLLASPNRRGPDNFRERPLSWTGGSPALRLGNERIANTVCRLLMVTKSSLRRAVGRIVPYNTGLFGDECGNY